MNISNISIYYMCF